MRITSPRPFWYGLASIALMTPCIGVMAVNGVIPGMAAMPATPVAVAVAAVAAGLGHLLTRVLQPRTTSTMFDTKIVVAICALTAVLVAILEMNRANAQPHGAMTSLLVLMAIAVAGSFASSLRFSDPWTPPEGHAIAAARRIGPIATIAACAAIAAGPSLLTSWLASGDPGRAMEVGSTMAKFFGMSAMYALITIGFEGVLASLGRGFAGDPEDDLD